MERARLLLLLCFCMPLVTHSRAAESSDSLVIAPGDFTLIGPYARQTVVVLRERAGRSLGAPHGQVTLTVDNPAILQIVDGVALPRANGSARITARVPAGEHAGLAATCQVQVTAFDQPFQWNFRNHVENVLTKGGCNSGACHGAAAGKNGFKLSLRAYDPERDYFTLTRQSFGRRITPDDPGRSLLLTKPTGAIPHGGGVRFAVESRDYQVLAGWIASGAPAPADSDARLTRIELLPERALLRPGMKQQLITLAHYSDGRREDVTQWAKYTAADASVAEVNETGLVHVMGHGEGAVSAWFGSQVAIASITSPFESTVDASVFASAPRRNFIDDMVLEKLAELRIPPSPPASDAEFLRRAFLDTMGVLPTPDETRAFLGDSAADKRDRLVESLLARPEYVDYWTYKWSDLLLVSSEKLPVPAMWAYHNWIRNRVAAGVHWDQFAREVITAQGNTLENGAANFFVLHEEPLDTAETISVAFLGMSINCARCHNHPLEKWTNDQYYAMANLLARVRVKSAAGEGARMVFSSSEGELIQPATGKTQPPCPLDAEPMAADDPRDRRVVLADWVTSPENPYFSRAIVNRIWANYFGVGLVEAVDDLRLTNPASNAPLHQALAQYLEEQKFDTRALMRLILQSTTYQRSSAPVESNEVDRKFYSRYYPKRLMAEVMLDAFGQVTGTPGKFANYPPDWRALQLPDSKVANYFLKTFGRPDRVTTCECERTAEPTMVQALHIANGESLNARLQAAESRLTRHLAAGLDNGQIVDELYLAALCRAPTDTERQSLVAQLDAAPADERRLAIEDLYWSVLSSKEFLFNH